LIEKLPIYPANMQKNLDRSVVSCFAAALIALTQGRKPRRRLQIQRNAMPVWRGEGDFRAAEKIPM
jgi:adenylosuccinate lyase